MTDSENSTPNYARRRLIVAVTSSVILLLTLLVSLFIWQHSNSEISAAKAKGLAAYENGRFEEAVALLSRAVEADDNNPELLTKLAIARVESEGSSSDTYADAVTLLETALAADSGAYNARRLLIMLYLKLNRDLDALDHADQLLAVYPSDTTTYRLRTELLAGLQEFDQLLDAADQVDVHVKNDHELAVEQCIARSVAYQGLDDRFRAYEWAERALRHDPANQRALDIWVDRALHLPEKAITQIAWLESNAKRNAEDPRHTAAMARACRMMAEAEQISRFDGAQSGPSVWMARGGVTLEEFIRNHAPDSRSLSLLRELDFSGRSAATFDWLAEGIRLETDAKLWAELAWRGWMGGRLEEVATAVEASELEPSGSQWREDFLAIIALAYQSLGDETASLAWREKLAGFDTAVARFWLEQSDATAPETLSEATLREVLNRVPAHPAAGLIDIDRLLQGEAVELATERLTLLANAYPGWSEPAIRLSRLAIARNDPRAALAWAERARNVDARSNEAAKQFLAAVGAGLDLITADQALGTLDMIGSWKYAEDQTADLYLLRLHLQLVAGDVEAAAAIYDLLYTSSEFTADQAIAVARRAQRVGEYGFAERVLTRSLDSVADTDAANIKLTLADLYLGLGRIAEAELLLEPSGNAFDPRASVLAYRIAVQNGDTSAADDLKSRVQQSSWAEVDQLAWLGDAYLASGAWEDARDVFAQAADQQPATVSLESGRLLAELALLDPEWLTTWTQRSPGLAADPRFSDWQTLTLDADNPLHRESLKWALRQPDDAGLYASWLRRYISGQLSVGRDTNDPVPSRLTPGIAALSMRDHMASGRLDRAVELARQVTVRFAGEPELLSETTAILLQASELEDALVSAKAWSFASTHDAFTPTMVSADLLLRLDRPAEARQMIAPYMGYQDASTPQAKAIVIILARSWLASGDIDLAWGLFEAKLEDDKPEWKSVATQIANGFISDAETRKAWLRRMHSSQNDPVPSE